MDDARRTGTETMRVKQGASQIHPRICALLLCTALFLCASFVAAQLGECARSFPQSKSAVEKALKDLQSASAGRLPTLDGFAAPTDHLLENYRRGYYQAKFQVSAAPSGGSIVRVSVQVTAWYNDPAGSKSGYRVLPSNGRLEGDLLDQLSDQLASAAPAPPSNLPVTAAAQPAKAPVEPEAQPSKSLAVATPPPSVSTTASTEPEISAPMPRLPDANGTYPSSTLERNLAATEKTSSPSDKNKKKFDDEDIGGPLQTELDNLQEILKNQGHPKNLVAVKKSGTPVVSSPSLTAKTLFLATAHDEFEMLDYNRDWVHVRISGLSRGWIWRNNLELPPTVPNSDVATSKSALPSAAELFRVSREEVAQFPGDWAPLRGKNVKIVSVEDTQDNAKTDSLLRLEFAKSVIQKDYAELAQKTQELAGIVVIFDSVDGGMVAAAFPTLQQWKAGKLSDAALWHQCFFDPPETFGVPNPSSATAEKPSGSGF
jgi:hypothetical protein